MARKIKTQDPARLLGIGQYVSWCPRRPTSHTTSKVDRETPAQWVLDNGWRVRKSDGHILGQGYIGTVEVVARADVVDNNNIDQANRQAVSAVSGDVDLPSLSDLVDAIERPISEMRGRWKSARVVTLAHANAIRACAITVRAELNRLRDVVDHALKDTKGAT